MSLRLNPAVLFDSSARGRDLASRSVRGGISTLAGQLTRTLVQMVGTVVLARLLTPADYGLIGMATVVIGFAQMFKDAGLSTATIQQAEITERQISTLFWVNAGVSALIGLLVLAVSPLVALFYGRAELTAVTAALSVTFLFSGLSIQHESLLRRHMRFVPLAVSSVVSQTVNVIVAIVAALYGLGYWSLVLGALVAAAVSTGLALYFCPWIPGLVERGTGARAMLRFGSDVAGFNFVNYFARNADNILIGRFIGAEPLGLYSKAYQLFMLPISQVRGPMSDVAMPTLSALKHDPDRYSAYYRRFLDVLGLLTVPITVYCMIEAEFIIGVLLGRQWLDAVLVFRLLAIAGVTQAVGSTRGLVLLSCGLSREYLHLGLANSVVTVTSFAIGLPFGIEGVALAYAVSSTGFLVPSLYLFMRKTPIAPRDFYRALSRPVAHVAVAAVAAIVGQALLPPESWTTHALILVVFVGVYSGLSLLNSQVRSDLKVFARLASNGRKGGTDHV